MMEAPPRESRGMFRRIVRRLVARFAPLRMTRRRGIGLGAIVLALIIAVGTLNLGSLPGLQMPSLGGGQGRPQREGEPNATAMYFKGQEAYDAKLVWDSYSDRLIREAQRRGITIDDTQRQFDRAKQVGNSIRQADYIGGYPISNGNSMHFYIVFRADPNQREPIPVPYVFTLDSGGKIDYIE